MTPLSPLFSILDTLYSDSGLQRLDRRLQYFRPFLDVAGGIHRCTDENRDTAAIQRPEAEEEDILHGDRERRHPTRPLRTDNKGQNPRGEMAVKLSELSYLGASLRRFTEMLLFHAMILGRNFLNNFVNWARFDKVVAI